MFLVTGKKMDHYRRSLRNPFSGCSLDRASEKWRDGEWLAAQLEAPATRFVPVCGVKNLFTAGPQPRPVFLSPADLGSLAVEEETPILLGVKEGRAYFAIELASQEDPTVDLPTAVQFQDLRRVGPLLEHDDGALLAYARAMVYWHSRNRFCGDCGSPTRSVEAGHLRICTDERCGQQHFPRTDPAIIVLVTAGGRCLLGRQPTWPEGRHSTIAGFVEPGESLEDAVVREVREETGVRVGEIHYHSSQPWPFPRSLMLGFTAVAASEEIDVGQGELESARWFTRAELRKALQSGLVRLPTPVSISFHLIEDWFDEGGQGPLRVLSKGV